MNTRKLLATSLIALASVAATSAFAGNDSDYPVLSSSPSSLTRAEVQAEVLQARKDGTLSVENDHNYPVVTAAGPAKTRAEVRAEVAAAAKAGALDIRGDYHS